MNTEKCQQLALEVQDVIKKYNVNFEDFALYIRVSDDYFATIEDKPPPTDVGPLFVQIYRVVDENRTVVLTESPQIGKISSE